MSFANKVISFNKQLELKTPLPLGIQVMNPFKEYEHIITTSSNFYKKYYSDNNKRHLILGINPGRLGAGLTGIPFTDPKHLIEKCQIEYRGQIAHEPSSVFIYEMIEAFGGIELFYSKFYINSVCPLGFTSIGKNNKPKNYNYYDSKELLNASKDFICKSIEQQIKIGIFTDVGFCLGNDKNFNFLLKINNEKQYFDKIVPLSHPRYIMQYKAKDKLKFINDYITNFKNIK